MGYSLQLDAGQTRPLASNRGWADLLAWVSGLPEGEFMTLRHLCEYGWTGNPADLREEVPRALADHAPTRIDVQDTAENLVALLDGEYEVVTVTDGLGADDSCGGTGRSVEEIKRGLLERARQRRAARTV